MSNTASAARDGVYVENENFVPDPTDQYGTLDTSGTAGAAHQKVEEVTKVFEVADAQNAIIAKRALDPDDDEIPSYLVTMPPGQNLVPVDEDAIRERVTKVGEKAESEPITLGAPTPAQQQAAQEGPAAASTAESQRADQGVGGKASQVDTGAASAVDTSGKGGTATAPKSSS